MSDTDCRYLLPSRTATAAAEKLSTLTAALPTKANWLAPSAVNRTVNAGDHTVSFIHQKLPYIKYKKAPSVDGAA